MQRFEYKAIPAPKRGEKAKGAKTTADRFAAALTTLMNDMGRDGWDYLRADTLPCEERVGLTGKATHFQNMLVFRRALSQAVAALPAPTAGLAAPVPELEPEPELVRPAPLVLHPQPAQGASPILVAAPLPGPARSLGPAPNGLAAE